MTISYFPEPHEIIEALVLHVPVEADFNGPWVGYLTCYTDEEYQLEVARAPGLDACVRKVFEAVGPEHRLFRLRRPGEARSEAITREDLQSEAEVAR